MSNAPAETIRLKLHASRRGRRGRFSLEARSEATAWLVSRHASGTTQAELARVLGIDLNTVSAWLRAASASDAQPASATEGGLLFRPVRVSPPVTRELTFVTSRGHRVEGLTVELCAALIRATS